MKFVSKCLLVAILPLAVGACDADGTGTGRKVELSLTLGDKTTARDVELPEYPGSKAYTEDDDSSSGANIGFSTSRFGFKVTAVKLETPDAPTKVSVFYHKALSKYGKVLECSEDAATQDHDELTCDSGDPGEHSVVYKAGTREDQRIVAIKPHGGGTRFSLIHLELRGDAAK